MKSIVGENKTSASVVLFTFIPASVPTKLFPLLNSTSESATIKLTASIVVVVPETVKFPLTVTVLPLSLIKEFVNCLLVLSHFIKRLSVKLVTFFNPKTVAVSVNPPVAEALYVVFASVELIVNVFPERVTVVNPEPVIFTTPVTALPSASAFAFTEVTVLLSVEEIVTFCPTRVIVVAPL